MAKALQATNSIMDVHECHNTKGGDYIDKTKQIEPHYSSRDIKDIVSFCHEHPESHVDFTDDFGPDSLSCKEVNENVEKGAKDAEQSLGLD